MAQLNTYLTFNGNCREGMGFYKNCLGGNLLFQTIGQSPLADKMTRQMKGNAVSLMLDCSTEKEINDCFKKLSVGGKADHPLEMSFWGALFGGLTDKYGNHWLLHFDKSKKTG